MARVVVTTQLPDIALDILGAAGLDVWQNPGDRSLTPAELRSALAGEDTEAVLCLLSDRLDEETMAAAPRLRVIANHAVGTDNVDLEAAARRGIVVTNTPDVLTEATADLTWALILAVARRVVEGDALVRRGEFHGWHPLLLLGQDLTGRRLGVVGAGRIGQAVIRRAAGWRMEVAYCGRSPRPELERETAARRMELDPLLEWADIVSLHVPLTPGTHHLLDTGRLALLRPSAILVNTSRGPVVDEEALVAALREGRLGGAGLDVFEREPAVHPGLLDLQSVVLLPHAGSATLGARTAMARLAAQSIVDVLAGRPPAHPVRARSGAKGDSAPAAKGERA